MYRIPITETLRNTLGFNMRRYVLYLKYSGISACRSPIGPEHELQVRVLRAIDFPISSQSGRVGESDTLHMLAANLRDHIGKGVGAVNKERSVKPDDAVPQ